MSKPVRFLVDDKPSGNLYTRRQHGRRVTPYPSQLQALIDGGLLTSDYYVPPARPRRGDADVESLFAGDRPHVLRDLWQKFCSLFPCA